MNLLVDTCTALWYWSGDSRLSDAAEAALRDPDNEIWFHQASYLEITVKYSIGKLSLRKAPSTLVPEAIRKYRFSYTTLSNPDIATLETLPFHHRDPFDRLLISRALNRQWTVVTSDRAFPAYGVKVLW